MTVGAIGSVMPGMAVAMPALGGVAGPASVPVTNPALGPDKVQFSAMAVAMCDADKLCTALVMALLSGPKKKEDLMTELAIDLLLLQRITDSSPYMQMIMSDGQSMIALTGDVSGIMASGGIAAMFSGGMAGIVGIMGAGAG